MAKIIILNASPRAPKSNSRLYADIFIKAVRKKQSITIFQKPIIKSFAAK